MTQTHLLSQTATDLKTATVENAVGFLDTLKVAFPDWVDFLLFFALVVVGFSAGKILKYVALAISGKARQIVRGKWASPFIVFNSFVRALPVSFLAVGVFAYRLYRFPESGVHAADEQVAIELLNRVVWFFAIIAQTQVLWNLVKLPISVIKNYAERNHRNSAFSTLVPLTEAVLQILVLFWGLLLVVRIMTDRQPAEIIAMIGIGGLAVSLASQDTVKNFFGTAMLVIDRPFSVGDFIDVGSATQGTVVRIGLRSTRLRTLEDHEISIPNADLANRVITTISSREKIRRVMNIGLVYDTPPEKIEEAVSIISSILNTSGKLAAESTAGVFFSDFMDSSLNIRVIYAYANSNVAEANAFAHTVNLEILRQFNAAGIAFAFPTQTIELKKTL